MDLQSAYSQRRQVEQFLETHRLGLLTLLFTDMVGSTRLKQTLGDAIGASLIERHHTLVRQTLSGFRESEEISTSGDSFFIIFSKPSDAVRFALELQRNLRLLSMEVGTTLQDRIGVHVGEVLIHETDAKKDLYGMQIDLCARIASVAGASQLLVSRSVFDSARQVLRGQDIPGVGTLSWLSHGSYEMAGIDDAVEVCEVGEVGQAPLSPPVDSTKVRRHVSATEEPVLGWRPAIGSEVPGTQCRLVAKLGEGGFGEVWLAQHERLKEQRVFKFCFRADRVRALKRELTLFRVLKEKVGQHPNIVGVQEVSLDVAPFYLVMDYGGAADLKRWCAEKGGPSTLSLDEKLELVAQAGDALQAAHDSGVIHRDVKPSNILISEGAARVGGTERQLLAKLGDFGIGQVLSEEILAGVTRDGFTETMHGSGTHAGTQMYLAPELLAGKSASIRSDIYSLGVVLYQLLIDDLNQPLTDDWRRRVNDPMLVEDLEKCFAGDPQERFAGAGELSHRLRGFGDRKEAERVRVENLERLERQAYRRGSVKAALAASTLIVAFAALAIVAWRGNRTANREAIRAQELARLAESNATSATLSAKESKALFRNIASASGHRLLEEGGEAEALSWYVEALKRAEGEPEVERDLRVLIGSLLRQRPVLDRFVPFDRLLSPHNQEAVNAGDPLTDRMLSLIPDGRGILFQSTLTAGTTLEIFDFSGLQLRDIKSIIESPLPAEQMTFSPRGNLVAYKQGSRICVHVLPSGKLIRTFEGKDGDTLIPFLEQLGFTGDERLLIGIGSLGGIGTWDIGTGKRTVRLDHVASHLHAGGELVVAEDADSLAGAVIDLTSGKTVREWVASTNSPILTVSPDGTVILRYEVSSERLIMEDSLSGELRASIHLEIPAQVRAGSRDVSQFLAMSQDGRAVALVLPAKEPMVWIPSANQLHTLTASGWKGSLPVGFSPDGRWVVLVGNDLLVWDPRTAVQHSIPVLGSEGARRMWKDTAWGEAGTLDLVFSSDSDQVYVADPRGLSVWRLGQRAATALPHSSSVHLAEVDPSDRYVFTGSVSNLDLNVWTWAGMLQTNWHLVSELTPQSLFVDSARELFVLQGTHSPTSPLEWDTFRDPDATRTKTNSYGFWSIATGAATDPGFVSEFQFRDARVALRYPFSGSITGGRPLKPRIPAQQSPLPLESLPWERFDSAMPRPRWVIISANNSMLAVGSRDGALQVSRPDGTLIASLEGGGINLLCGDFSIDDRFLIIGFSNATLCRYEVGTGKLVKSIRTPLLELEYPVELAIEVNQDASKVVLRKGPGSPECETEVWDLESGRILGKWGVRFMGSRRFGRTSRLDKSLDWRLRAAQAFGEDSPDGLFRATWNTNGWVQVWSVSSADRITVPLKHGGRINAVRFNKDGTKLVTGCEDRLARIWDLSADLTPTEELQRQAEFLSGKALSPAGLMERLTKERNQEMSAYYFGNLTNWVRSAWTNEIPNWLAQLAEGRPSAPERLRTNSLSPIDLTAHYNASLSGAWHFGAAEGSDLSEVPQGELELEGTSFDVRGLIQVGWKDRSGLEYPTEVTDIVISNRCQRLHFLHSAINAFSIKDQREIGHYLVHYADGSATEIPIVTHKDVSDWFEQSGEEDDPFEVAWRGESEYSRQVGRKIRLFKSSWENPKPDVPIRTIDFVSTAQVVAPFLVALTRE